jgi:hypothetical protein
MKRGYYYSTVLGLLCLAIAAAGLLQERFEAQVESTNNQLAALLAPYDGIEATFDSPTKTSGCTSNGPLPDPDCSPGAIFASSTVEDICTPGYSSSVRNVSVSLKKKIYGEYGLTYPQPTGSYEVDHIIPLELGGSNDRANLYPEAAEPAPGFHEKDIVEDYLHQEVCAGHIELSAAQQQIANDWIAVYRILSTTDIQNIKSKFHNWAD